MCCCTDPGFLATRGSLIIYTKRVIIALDARVELAYTMSGMRTALASIGVFGLFGVGYGMWAIIAPGEDRKKEILKVLKHCSFINEKHKPI